MIFYSVAAAAQQYLLWFEKWFLKRSWETGRITKV